jgi:hypothetical protein
MFSDPFVRRVDNGKDSDLGKWKTSTTGVKSDRALTTVDTNSTRARKDFKDASIKTTSRTV